MVQGSCEVPLDFLYKVFQDFVIFNTYKIVVVLFLRMNNVYEGYNKYQDI